jgi:hypothetical protein
VGSGDRAIFPVRRLWHEQAGFWADPGLALFLQTCSFWQCLRGWYLAFGFMMLP